VLFRSDLALVINEGIVYQMSYCDLHISHSKLRLCRREWDKAYHAQFYNQSTSLKEYVGSDSVVCDYSDIIDFNSLRIMHTMF
jgi:hypothetical protein